MKHEIKIKIPRTKKQRQIDVAHHTFREGQAIAKTGNLATSESDANAHYSDNLKHNLRIKYPANNKANIEKRYDDFSKHYNPKELSQRMFEREEWANAINNRVGPFTLHKKYKNKKGFHFEEPDSKNRNGRYNPITNNVVLYGQAGKLSSTILHEEEHKKDYAPKNPDTHILSPITNTLKRIKKIVDVNYSNTTNIRESGGGDFYKDAHHDKPAFEMRKYKDLVKKGKKR